MYKATKNNRSSIVQNDSTQGEPIEAKVERMISNKEPIKDEGALNFTSREDGVRPEMDIRTDRAELALDAVDKKTQQILKRRQDAIDAKKPKKDDKKTPDAGEGGNVTTDPK